MMQRRHQHGFTLLELLVVLVIVGLMLGAVSLNAMPSDLQRLQNDSRRIALLLQLAREEAIVRNLPVAFEADQTGYRFLVREDRVWTPIKDDMLRERAFQLSPVQLQVEPSLVNVAVDTHVRILFGHEPVDKPFILTLRAADQVVRLTADGIGHFDVE